MVCSGRYAALETWIFWGGLVTLWILSPQKRYSPHRLNWVDQGDLQEQAKSTKPAEASMCSTGCPNEGKPEHNRELQTAVPIFWYTFNVADTHPF